MRQLIIDRSNADLYRGGFASDGTYLTPDSAFMVRPIDLAAGQRHKGHAHYIDHVGNLVSGQARVHWRREDGSDEGVIEMLVPAKVLIRADTWHEIEAVTDCVWECWFAAASAAQLDPESRARWYLEKPHGQS
jgi:quercetin dioxygenase-like cupin family protein